MAARLDAPSLAAIAVGAAAGAVTRHSISEMGKIRGQGPAAIIVINVLGSFLLGGIMGAVPGTPTALLAGTGFCGAFTTYSTYALDVVKLVQAGHVGHAAAYAASTNVLSIGAAAAGLQLGRSPAVVRAVRRVPLPAPRRGLPTKPPPT